MQFVLGCFQLPPKPCIWADKIEEVKVQLGDVGRSSLSHRRPRWRILNHDVGQDDVIFKEFEYFGGGRVSVSGRVSALDP